LQIHTAYFLFGYPDSLIASSNPALICPEGVTRMPLVSTGISGFDESVGGLPDRSVILLLGGTGTGAELFAQQFLFNSAKKGSRILYITIEKPPNDVREELTSLGMNVAPFESLKPPRWLFVDAFTPRRAQRQASISLLTTLTGELAQKIENSYTVIDSISYLLLRYDIVDVMDGIELLLHLSRDKGGIHFLIMNPNMHDPKTVHTILHIVDAALEFQAEEKGQAYSRSLNVRKMKKASHKMRIVAFRLTEKGIVFESETRVA